MNSVNPSTRPRTIAVSQSAMNAPLGLFVARAAACGLPSASPSRPASAAAIGAGAVLGDKGEEMSASPLDAAHETTRRITTLSVATAVLLIIMKAFALGASGSVSILASLADSALDLVASLATFFAVRWAAAPPDDEHRYGHGKAEGLASLVQSGMVLASGVFIGWEATQRIFDPRPVTAGGWAVGVVVLSIAVTAGLVWMQTQAMKKTGSLAVSADVVRAVGLAWGAVSLLKDAAGQLLDQAASDEDRAAIVAAVTEDARIANVHQLRARMAGQALMVQMHVDLDPELSLKAA